MNPVDIAIDKTESLVNRGRDPAMLEILQQLRQIQRGETTDESGKPVRFSISRIIAYQFTPADNAEIEQWADACLKVVPRNER